MKPLATPIIKSGFLLGLIALIGTSLLAGVNALTHERIKAQEEARMLAQFNAIVSADSYDNDLVNDRISMKDTEIFGHADTISVYRARRDGQPVAVLMKVTAPDGYNGDIKMLVGIDLDGVVLGVRIIEHRETPGLGDPIELERSDWILDFDDKSLQNPGPNGWAVKRDGGEFDQFTGATISPRAVVKTVYNSLNYYEANKQRLFEEPADVETPND
jgi:electron transport complex protein RnfG